SARADEAGRRALGRQRVENPYRQRRRQQRQVGAPGQGLRRQEGQGKHHRSGENSLDQRQRIAEIGAVGDAEAAAPPKVAVRGGNAVLKHTEVPQNRVGWPAPGWRSLAVPGAVRTRCRRARLIARIVGKFYLTTG